MKPLMVHYDKIGAGPLVKVNGPCAVRTNDLEYGDIVTIVHYRPSSNNYTPVADITHDGMYDLGVLKGWLQANRRESSGSKIDVFVTDEMVA